VTRIQVGSGAGLCTDLATTGASAGASVNARQQSKQTPEAATPAVKIASTNPAPQTQMAQ